MTLRVLLVVLMAAGAEAQESRFAAAAIKPTPEDKVGVGFSTSDTGGISMTGVTVQALAAQAFGVQNFQVSGGPKWTSTDRWDIDARTESGQRTTPEQVQQALRHLLEDRFQARLRLLDDDVSGYELVPGPKGHRLKSAANPTGTSSGYGPGMLNGRNMALADLAKRMSTLLDRPVVDKTGIQGGFDLSVTWRPELGEAFFGAPQAPGRPESDRSVFQAIEEDLGLKLVSKKVRVPVVKIEAVQRPSDN